MRFYVRLTGTAPSFKSIIHNHSSHYAVRISTSPSRLIFSVASKAFRFPLAPSQQERTKSPITYPTAWLKLFSVSFSGGALMIINDFLRANKSLTGNAHYAARRLPIYSYAIHHRSIIGGALYVKQRREKVNIAAKNKIRTLTLNPRESLAGIHFHWRANSLLLVCLGSSGTWVPFTGLVFRIG